MDWRERTYYFVYFDSAKQNIQVHQLKSIFSVKVRLGHSYTLVGVSQLKKKEFEEMLENFKENSATRYKLVEYNPYTNFKKNKYLLKKRR